MGGPCCLSPLGAGRAVLPLAVSGALGSGAHSRVPPASACPHAASLRSLSPSSVSIAGCMAPLGAPAQSSSLRHQLQRPLPSKGGIQGAGVRTGQEATGHPLRPSVPSGASGRLVTKEAGAWPAWLSG